MSESKLANSSFHISVFGLMNVPIGSVIGVYTLIVLLTGDPDRAFGSVERKAVLAEGIA